MEKRRHEVKKKRLYLMDFLGLTDLHLHYNKYFDHNNK